MRLHALHLLHADWSTRMRIKLTLLNGEYTAPSGHKKRQNGLFTKSAARTNAARSPILIQ
jgi:hypothetical protein